MKPTNLEGKGCDPISSNCVIWQGPDIECLALCKGDTVSDVVSKLATEFCDLLTALDIETFDFTCLNITDCQPANFHELFQLLIERICALEGIDPATGGTTNGCPDCVVNIATCFYFLNAVGDTVTTMQLTDYITAIGNKICEILQDIIDINATLADHEGRLTALEGSETGLVNDFEAMQAQMWITPKYVLDPGVRTPIDDVVTEVEKQFGELQTATGDPNAIYTGMAKMVPGVNSLDQLAGDGNLSAMEGWNAITTNLADQYANVLLMLKDMRAAILNLNANLPTVCSSVTVDLVVTMPTSTTLKLYFRGTLPTGWTDCDISGTQVTIEDTAGGQHIIKLNVSDIFNNASGFIVDLTGTPVNVADDLTIKANTCFADPATGSQCQDCVEFFLNNVYACPSMVLTPTDTTVGYQFNHLTTDSASYLIELYDSSGTSLLQSITEPVTGPATITGSFSGLSPDYDYKVKVSVTAGTTTTECPFSLVSTVPSPCTPPSGVGATITIN